MVQIEFTPSELEHAAFGGFRRRLDAIQRNGQPRYGLQADDPWGFDINSAIAEAAVARWLNLYWSTGRIGAPDVGTSVEVRSTHRLDGCLLLHPPDRDDAPYVLVTGTGLTRNIIGWITGRHGKQQKWWRTDTGRPAFFVPQSALHPAVSGESQ